MNLQLPDDVHWKLEPELRDLLPVENTDIGAAIASGEAEIVKQGRFRTVYRVHLPKIDLFVKHCRPANWRAWLRECFRPAKAILEFRKLRAAAAKNLPSVAALGCGKRNGFLPGDSVLITRSIPNAFPLGQYLLHMLPQLSEKDRTRKRQAIARTLGRFLAELHRAGVIHPDLHPDNLLLSWCNENPVFHLVDVHGVQTGQPCALKNSLRNLALLNRWFMLRASRSDRLRFWMAYSARRWELERKEWPPVLARELEILTQSSNFRLWRSWAKRCFGKNRRFMRLRSRGIRGHSVRDAESGQLSPIMSDPDRPFREPIAPLLKNSRSSSVTELNFAGSRVIYKCFRVGSMWDSLANHFRRSPCLRSWQNGHAFLDCLLPTPRPIAVWHRRRFALCREGYLITERIPKAEDLHQFLQRLQTLPQPQRSRRLWEALDELGRQIRCLHERGWAHRDLKATNILIRNEDTIRVWFIDLVGAWRPWRLRDSRRQKDVARLNASTLFSQQLSQTDRLRFLRAYMNWNLHGKRGWKGWWRAIANHTAAKVRRNRNRGRPLT